MVFITLNVQKELTNKIELSYLQGLLLFLLFQVTAIELEGVGGQDSIMYDITLCELNDS